MSFFEERACLYKSIFCNISMKIRLKFPFLLLVLFISLAYIFKSFIIIYYDLSSDFFYSHDFRNNHFEQKIAQFMICIKVIPPLLLILVFYFFKRWEKEVILSLFISLILYFATIPYPTFFFRVTKNIAINNLISVVFLSLISFIAYKEIKKLLSDK